MSLYIEKLDNTRKVITPGMAQKLRMAWSTKETTTPEQKAYLSTIRRIVYGPDQAFCFCRYEHTKTIPMKYSKLYVMQCAGCKQHYTSDTPPKT